jgi:hypothetical protein
MSKNQVKEEEGWSEPVLYIHSFPQISPKFFYFALFNSITTTRIIIIIIIIIIILHRKKFGRACSTPPSYACEL